MNKIKEIILNDNYYKLDKLIMIYREVDKDNDIESLAEAVGIPAVILKTYVPAKIQEVEVKKNKLPMKKYIDIFDRMYKKLYGRTFRPFPGKEIGQLKNIIKAVKTPAEWEKLLRVVYYEVEKYKRGENQKFTWKCISERPCPSRIYKYIDFVLTEAQDYKKKKSWEGYGEKN